MKYIGLFFMLVTLSFASKVILPELDKNENKELIITLKIKEKLYIVRQGDTVESVAEKFEMSVEELRRRNNLAEDEELKIGATLQVDEVSES